jgi:hypothetical protein
MKHVLVFGRNTLTTAVLVLTSVLSPTGHANAYDDFESYTNTQVLATATSNTVVGSAWGRFGAATSVNPTAFTNQGVAGSTAMRYTLNWGLGNNGNLVFWFDFPVDLTSAPGVSMDLRVNALVLSNTTARAAFENPDGTVWTTLLTLAPVLGTNYQTYTFGFVEADMSRTSGSGSFDLSSVRTVRIRFDNFGGAGSGSQQVFLDNFQAIPEPSTLALVGLALSVGGWAIRRRREPAHRA